MSDKNDLRGARDRNHMGSQGADPSEAKLRGCDTLLLGDRRQTVSDSHIVLHVLRPVECERLSLNK